MKNYECGTRNQYHVNNSNRREGKQLADLVGSVQKSAAFTSPNPLPIEDSTAKVCPKCGAEMVLKTARQGKYAGQKFWSCSKFPACRGLLPVKDGDA